MNKTNLNGTFNEMLGIASVLSFDSEKAVQQARPILSLSTLFSTAKLYVVRRKFVKGLLQ